MGETKSSEQSDTGPTMDLATLVKQRGIIKGRLTKFSDYLTNLSDSGEINSKKHKELEMKVETFRSLMCVYDTLQNKIDILHADSDEQVKERDSIENQFVSLLSLAEEIIDSSPNKPKSVLCNDERDQASIYSCQSSNKFNNSIKLPTIVLPTFDGNYLSWLEYRDTFESMINGNDSIPPINKFHYLRSSLQGSAALVIKSIEFSASNYATAWDLLCQRYNNVNILINNHLKALFGIESMVKESFKVLRFIIDHVSKHLRALENLGQPTDKWDALIIFMVSTKLDINTSRKWEEFKCNTKELPTLDQFYSFLRGRADVLETAYNNRSDRGDHYKSFPKDTRPKYPPQTKSFIVSQSNKKRNNCPMCDDTHYLHQCPKFKQMSVSDRMNEINNLHLCKNCFRGGHNAVQCQLRGLCRECRKKHNTLLHTSSPSTADNNNAQPSTSSMHVSLSAVSTGQVLLCTALIEIKVANDNTYTARALLDMGSQSSFMTSAFKERIGLTGESTNPINILGINNAACNIKETCRLIINSKVNSFSFEANCLVVPQITGLLPNSNVDVSNLNVPTHIKLADPTFHRPAEIDILLGADVYWTIVGSSTIKLGVHNPILLDSKLGWLVAGPIGNNQTPSQVKCNFSQEIRDSLEKFWAIDDLSPTKTYSVEEKLCEAHFVETTCRLPNGRFSVEMPLKEAPEQALGDTYYIAKACLESQEKKFAKFPNLKQKYREFLKEYSDLGHLSKIEKPIAGYYMPHHAVMREKSETTKLRVVFNASQKSSSGKSLNSIQMVGPVVQSDLFSILLRFREHKFVVTADIEKMYRQIEIAQPQRNLQLILWRDEKNLPIEVLQLNTVTYGTASAPFLSTRCLLQLALECSDEVIANVIRNDFYVDDLSTGSDTINGLRHIVHGVVKALDSACLPLRKFRTNCPQLFDNDENTSKTLDLSKEASVLGLNWSPKSDTLHFQTDLEPSPQITKRTVISTTCKIFDPLGLLSPCVIVAKILLQQLWSSKLDWDDPVPQEFTKNWCNLLKEFSVLSQINVPRYVLCDDPQIIELHCFVDSSQIAYGCSVYLRSISKADNQVHVHLLCSKARVAPIKPLTIPRLELCGALLGARLCQKVLQSLRCEITRKYIWTDSTVVLGWIKTQSKDLKAFVCNRVNEIGELTRDFTFLHVPTDENPADLASRGTNPRHLMSSLLWWEGPSYLRSDPCEWPKQTYAQINDLPEIKQPKKYEQNVQCYIQSNANEFVQFTNYSNLNKLYRIYAYVNRFVNNCKAKKPKLTGPLNVNEINNSMTLLVKKSQSQAYSDEIQAIQHGKQLPRGSKLLSLDPFLDSAGVLRVGGRIQQSEFSFDKKHPMIVDSKHHLTKLIMSNEHMRLFHAGPQLLLASVRERFWPIGGRVLARSTTKQCVVCTRLKGDTLQPMMGSLPAVRNIPTYAFHTCGVDMAGPFMISSRKGKGNRISKCYLCLFVCLTTKAVHLELVSDLSTDAFLLSLRRFVSRRGKPATIYSDNGTNFKGANNELSRLLRSSRQSVTQFANEEGIKFMFSPAYSPHFGGIWEAGVRCAKFHLKRIAGNASLTFEELTTLFAQIESILNSRPLTPLSSDPNDPTPLTPGHFLIGRPLTSVPSAPITTKRPNRYQLIEQLRQHFWERWRLEYVAELQQRTKWRTRQRELRVGDLVILKEEHVPPLQWRLARISRLFPGPDGISRVADVLTSKGIIRRALNKMCVLPTTTPENEPSQASTSLTSAQDQ